MSRALMMGRVVTPARNLMSAALWFPWLVRCVLLCELSADGCGTPANWVAEWRGEDLDSGNAIENV